MSTIATQVNANSWSNVGVGPATVLINQGAALVAFTQTQPLNNAQGNTNAALFAPQVREELVYSGSDTIWAKSLRSTNNTIIVIK